MSGLEKSAVWSPVTGSFFCQASNVLCSLAHCKSSADHIIKKLTKNKHAALQCNSKSVNGIILLGLGLGIYAYKIYVVV